MPTRTHPLTQTNVLENIEIWFGIWPCLQSQNTEAPRFASDFRSEQGTRWLDNLICMGGQQVCAPAGTTATPSSRGTALFLARVQTMQTSSVTYLWARGKDQKGQCPANHRHWLSRATPFLGAFSRNRISGETSSTK